MGEQLTSEILNESETRKIDREIQSNCNDLIGPKFDAFSASARFIHKAYAGSTCHKPIACCHVIFIFFLTSFEKVYTFYFRTRKEKPKRSHCWVSLSSSEPRTSFPHKQKQAQTLG